MISAFGTQLLVTSMDAMKASLIKMWKVSPPSQFPQLLHLLEEMEVHKQSYDGANFNCKYKISTRKNARLLPRACHFRAC